MTINKDKNNEPRTIIANANGGGYEIEIKSDSKVDLIQGTSKKTGNPYKMVKQEAWLHTGYGYPVRCFIPLYENGDILPEDNAYKEGAYFMGDLISVGGWGDLQISRDFRLVLKTDVKKSILS